MLKEEREDREGGGREFRKRKREEGREEMLKEEKEGERKDKQWFKY